MNAAIRAVVRTATYRGLDVTGIIRGYAGMIEGDFLEMGPRSVGQIIQRGGTILKSARSEEFRTREGRKTAAENLRKQSIDGLVAIGGDGTYAGAKVFYEEYGIPTIGIPGTIDNDLAGTDFSLGFDTAINTALDAIDKIRDTADSHDRLFIVEVMGRHSGYIAMYTGIAGGAEVILVPENQNDTNYLISRLKNDDRRGKGSFIVVVAEGDESGGADMVSRIVKKEAPEYSTRNIILGHIQRGGTPTAADRILGSRLGSSAVVALLEGKANLAVGIVKREVCFTSLEDAIQSVKVFDPLFIELAKVLST